MSFLFRYLRGRTCQASASANLASSSSSKAGKSRQKQNSILPMLDKFHDIIGGIHVPVDDGVDKLNRKYTLLVFLFLALPIFTKQYIGDPIECFAPVYFAEHQSRYINSYCWTQSTYYMVPVGDPNDDSDQQEPQDRVMTDEMDYFIGLEAITHIGNEKLRRVRVSYYQWAPLILLVQGLCFYIPFLIWNSCANNAGVKLRRLLKKASDIASLPPGCQQREALLAEFVDQFHTLVTGEAGWCADLQCGIGGGSGSTGGSSASSAASNSGSSANSQQSAPAQAAGRAGQRANQEDAAGDGRGGHHRQAGQRTGSSAAAAGQPGCCLVSIPIIGSLLACCLKPCSSFGLVGPSKYLCLLYLAVKFAYVFNVGLQFFLLGQFLGRGYLKHGLELINRLIVNGEWWASPRFPLLTLCQVRADMSGGLRSYTCQCVLPINVFNEKIFSVVWFYMAFLMPLNVLSLLFWIYRTFETNRLSYIRLCLWRTRLVELNQIHRTVRRLSQSYLGWDGVFLLRLIEHNHGSIMATLIMSRLWEFYANQMKLQEDANQLALASNAQHTLSNITTAVNQIGPGPGSGGGGGGGGGAAAIGHLANLAAASGPVAQHGPGHHGSGHAHAGPGPQLMVGAGGAHFGQHANHGHLHGHGAHSHGAFAAAGQAQQMAPIMGHAQQMAPMLPHGPHAHHSGQISQPGHHQVHAANPHHAHHAHAPHLSGPFGQQTNASLLAQLQQQHQQQQQQQQQQQHHTGSAGQSHGTSAGANQQPASGNVAAAVAALAAAAAANSTKQPTPAPLSGAGQASSAGVQPASAGQAGSASLASGAASSSGQAQAQSMHHHQGMHLQTLLQTAGGGPGCAPGAQTQAVQTSTTAAAAAATAANQQQQQQQPQSASLNLSGSLPPPAATLATPAPLSSGQQAAVSAAAAAAASSAAAAQTTSFINAVGGGPGGAQPGPPLPPPPPAHVVAAVAAAANSSIPTSSVAAAAASATPATMGTAAAPVAPSLAAGAAPVALTGCAQATTAAQSSTAGGLARTGLALAGAQAAATLARQPPPTRAGALGGQQQGAQPVAPPHTNPLLFNLKSSNIQAAANATRYSPHTIKR